MEKPFKNVVVFSGNNAPDEEHKKLAHNLGLLLARNSIGLVNGGGSGLMEVVAQATYMNGGYVTGVHFDFEGRKISEYNSVTLPYTDLDERQRKVLELGDLYIALPGGLGTLYEIIEVMSLKYVGNIAKTKPLILVDREYWQDLTDLLQSFVTKNYAKESIRELFTIVDTIEEVLDIVKNYEKK